MLVEDHGLGVNVAEPDGTTALSAVTWPFLGVAFQFHWCGSGASLWYLQPDCWLRLVGNSSSVWYTQLACRWSSTFLGWQDLRRVECGFGAEFMDDRVGKCEAD